MDVPGQKIGIYLESLANAAWRDTRFIIRRQQYHNKAELLQEGIFFLIHLFARYVLVMKKLEIEKTKPIFIISVLKVEYNVVLVSSLANKRMSFGSSNSALMLCRCVFTRILSLWF